MTPRFCTVFQNVRLHVGHGVAGVVREVAVGQEHRRRQPLAGDRHHLGEAVAHAVGADDRQSAGTVRDEPAAQREPRAPVEQPLDGDDDEAGEDDEQQRRHDLLDALVAAEHRRDHA